MAHGGIETPSRISIQAPDELSKRQVDLACLPGNDMSQKDDINSLRPPNPYDFGSICQYLDEVLSMAGIYDDYSILIRRIEAKENEGIGDKKGKEELQLTTFEQEPFELAMLKTFWALSVHLVEFKQKPQKEQDIKREFLHQENLGSLRNALSTAGFPDALGKITLGQKLPEFMDNRLSKALLKADRVFHRAFHFVVKDNELTRKNTDEIMDKLVRHDGPEDVLLYLNALLYKVEVASTENAFASMKRKITRGLTEHQEVCIVKREKLANDPEVTVEDSNVAKAYQDVRTKVSSLAEYLEVYFDSEDFIFVDKQVKHLQKGAKAEATEKNNKPLLSDEYSAGIEEKSMIQLITAFKKVYNLEELFLLKQYLLRDLLAADPESSEAAMTKFTSKKNVILEALKITRTNMIVEDVFNSVSDQKKQIIEAFEKELLRNSVSQLKGEVLTVAEKRSGSIAASAQRAVEAQQEEAKKKEEENNLGDKMRTLLVPLMRYSQGKGSSPSFHVAVQDIQPLLQDVLVVLNGMEKGEARDLQKTNFSKVIAGFSAKIEATSQLDNTNKRALIMWLKGILNRLRMS